MLDFLKLVFEFEYVRCCKKSSLQYKMDPEHICKNREEHKRLIFECIDKNLTFVLEKLMKRPPQRINGSEVSKTDAPSVYE